MERLRRPEKHRCYASCHFDYSCDVVHNINEAIVYVIRVTAVTNEIKSPVRIQQESPRPSHDVSMVFICSGVEPLLVAQKFFVLRGHRIARIVRIFCYINLSFV